MLYLNSLQQNTPKTSHKTLVSSFYVNTNSRDVAEFQLSTANTRANSPTLSTHSPSPRHKYHASSLSLPPGMGIDEYEGADSMDMAPQLQQEERQSIVVSDGRSIPPSPIISQQTGINKHILF